MPALYEAVDLPEPQMRNYGVNGCLESILRPFSAIVNRNVLELRSTPFQSTQDPGNLKSARRSLS